MPKAHTPKRLLTDAKIRAIKASGKRFELRDTLVPGFCLRVSEKGARTFVLKTRYPGSRHATRRAIGEYGVFTLEDARQKAADWLKRVRQGIDPAVEEERAKQAAIRQRANTFSAVAEDFIAQKLPGERKGDEVEADIRREFIPKIGHLTVTSIVDTDVLTIINGKKAKHPAQARNLLGTAKRIFAWAVDQRTYGLTTSPIESLKPTKIIGKKRSRKRVLSDLELFALWRAAEKTSYPNGPIYKLLILNALRLNEVADASRNEFDRTNSLWIIPAERMKGKDDEAWPHAVPLSADSIKIFDELPEQKKGSYLFSSTLGVSPVWVGDKVKKRMDKRMLLTLRALARRNGEDPSTVQLPRWINHDIRRTVRSNLSRLKVTEEAREAVLAHVRPGIKGTYDLYDYLDEKREALELWAARLRSLVEPAPQNVVRLRSIA